MRGVAGCGSLPCASAAGRSPSWRLQALRPRLTAGVLLSATLRRDHPERNSTFRYGRRSPDDTPPTAGEVKKRTRPTPDKPIVRAVLSFDDTIICHGATDCHTRLIRTPAALPLAPAGPAAHAAHPPLPFRRPRNGFVIRSGTFAHCAGVSTYRACSIAWSASSPAAIWLTPRAYEAQSERV